jgi:8-oxo-dGTP pyrophosphatase MutT (NUDIX family)
VLLRETSSGLEALLLRRLERMQFAPGAWVFPGGGIESTDRSAPLARCAATPDATLLGSLRARAFGDPLTASQALAICIAGCRETFEECGILLARQRDGQACSAQLARALQGERALMATAAERMVALLERHELVLETDALAYWSNWITPVGVPHRFDTRFFLAALPAGQEVDARLGEAQGACWLRLRAGSFWDDLDPSINAPPTLFTLRELAALYTHHGSLRQLMQVARAMPPVTVMAKIVGRGESCQGLFPWDEAYTAAAGKGVSCDAHLRRRLGHLPSRTEFLKAHGIHP